MQASTRHKLPFEGLQGHSCKNTYAHSPDRCTLKLRSGRRDSGGFVRQHLQSGHESARYWQFPPSGIVRSASEGRYSVLLGLDVGLPGEEMNLARTHRARSTYNVIRYLDVQKEIEDPPV